MPRIECDTYQPKHSPFGHIIYECMVNIGNDPDKCFECGIRLNDKNRQIHHLKYTGATIYDLRFGCSKCNRKNKYRNLK